METSINRNLLQHLEYFSLLNDHQYGFHKARSTEDLLSYVTHQWALVLEKFSEISVVALDISKAFDRVWHANLLSKLPACGFHPSPISLDRRLPVRSHHHGVC